MNLLITEISVSLVIAFLIGCFLAWILRGAQLRRAVSEAERQVEHRLQLEASNLHTEADALRDEIVELQAENEELASQTHNTPSPVLIASSAEEAEALKAKLTELDNRYAALHARWERERTQFAQLVAHKNSKIAELESEVGSSERAVIEDGTSELTEEDNQTYSRQQLETMLVDLRAQVADQETELTSLKQAKEHQTAAPATAPVGFMGGETDSSLRDVLTIREAELKNLREALAQRDDGSRLIDVERERATLLHRVSELNGLRANDAEHTATLHRDIDSLKHDLEKTTSEIEAHVQSIESAQQNQAALQAKLDATMIDAQKVPELIARCENLQGDVDTLQALIDQANTATENTYTDVDGTSSALPLAANASNQNRVTQRALQSEVESLENTLKSERRRAEEREQQIRRAHAELAELRPLQHQLINLRGSLGELIERDNNGALGDISHTEIESLRTRLAQLQADSKTDLERKERYYQDLLRKKSALISELQNQISESEPVT